MKLLNHYDIYKGHSTELYVDEIETDAGKLTKREVVIRPDAVVVMALEWHDGVLMTYLVKQFRYPVQGYLYELPAGKIEGGLTPLETAHKELEEEINFRAGSMRPIGSWYASPGYSTERIHAFLASDLTPVNQADHMADDTGEIEIVYVPMAEARNLCGDAKSLLCLARDPWIAE